jgi:hypothetical protein
MVDEEEPHDHRDDPRRREHRAQRPEHGLDALAATARGVDDAARPDHVRHPAPHVVDRRAVARDDVHPVELADGAEQRLRRVRVHHGDVHRRRRAGCRASAACRAQ